MKTSRNEQSREPLYSRSYPTRNTLGKLQRKRRRNIAVIGILIGILLVTTYLELHYLERPSIGIYALFNLNVTLLVLLVVLISRNLFKLFLERKQRHMGSRFRSKLVIAFIVMTMLPTVILAFIGSNLMADSIRNWFSPKIEEFLEDAMEIAQISHSNSESMVSHFAHFISETIMSENLMASSARESLQNYLIQKQNEYRFALIQIFDDQKNLIWQNSLQELPSGVYISGDSTYLKETYKGKEFANARLLGSGELLQLGVPIFSKEPGGKVAGALIVNLLIPEALTYRAMSVQSKFEKYKQQKQSIQPTQALYISMFLMIALIILFSAIWLGLHIARQISIPISHLAQATHEVARGNWDFKLDIMAYDEIGSLVQSFNRMTEQLRINREVINATTQQLRQTNQEIIERRNQLETILLNISAGVISVDPDGVLQSINNAAESILNLPHGEIVGKNTRSIFIEPHHSELYQLLEQALQQRSRVWQRELEIKTQNKLFVCSISIEPILDAEKQFNGVVVVLDDLTQFLRMQRIAAWREVARRLAHEIKNPLTPIQLNAQRLQKKFQSNSEDFKKIFEEATNSIIKEVNALRILLDEFSQFARMPEAEPKLENLHWIISEIENLYAGSNEGINIELHLDSKLPLMMLDSEQIKRVFINLIDNAIDAMNGTGKIEIETEYDPVFQIVKIVIADEGPGVPIEDSNKLFLPYFSTKGRGSGLGLAICNRIISDHDGTIRVSSNEPRGAKFIIELPIKIR
ncbi:PAS domain-containing protein [bacterium]|nr:PAS domain-containing protein [candidate division CSSED10-310 bacterium]